MTIWIALSLGVLIGAFLGALGGGGAILTVPALVYLLQQSARDATTSSIIIVGVAAATGMIGYAVSGHVRWRVGLLFGAAGIATAYAGTALNRQINQHYLLIGFAVVMLAAATAMLLRSRTRTAVAGELALAAGIATVRVREPTSSTHISESPAASGAGGGQLAPDTTAPSRWYARPVVKITLAGLCVGFLTGFFGVGGGFAIVPALVLLFDLPMTAAAATSLLIIAINSAVSLAARVSTAHFDWSIIVPFTIAAMAASLAGKLIAGRLPDKILTRTFAVMLIAIAVFVAVQNTAQLI